MLSIESAIRWVLFVQIPKLAKGMPTKEAGQKKFIVLVGKFVCRPKSNELRI